MLGRRPATADDAAAPSTEAVADAGTRTGDHGAPPTTTTVPTTEVVAAAADPALVSAIEAQLAANTDGCDPLDTRHCYLPFPSNFHTLANTDSATGRRVLFPAAGAPVNASGVPIDIAEWNRNDGFSPNSTILTYVADLDAEASRLPPWTDLEASLADDAPVVLVDLDTGERVPLWAELGRQGAPSPPTALLVIHPAVEPDRGPHLRRRRCAAWSTDRRHARRGRRRCSSPTATA